MYKRILVPVDGGPTSMRGLQEAVRLARDQKAQLILLHVVDELFITQAGGGIGFSEQFFESMRAGGRKALAKAEAMVRRGGVRSRSVMLETISTPVADLIVRQARKLRADLVVIGTHGRRGLTRAVLGSDAESVVRAATVPVLLVRARR